MSSIEAIAREVLGPKMFQRVEIDQSSENSEAGEVWIDVVYDETVADLTPAQMMGLAERAMDWDGRGDLAPVISFTALTDSPQIAAE